MGKDTSVSSVRGGWRNKKGPDYAGHCGLGEMHSVILRVRESLERLGRGIT